MIIETEAHWLDSTRLLDLMRHPFICSERKRRLLVCASIRRVLPELVNPIYDKAVDICEEFAEGNRSWADVLTIQKELRSIVEAYGSGGAAPHLQYAVLAVRKGLEKNFVNYKMAMIAALRCVGGKSLSIVVNRSPVDDSAAAKGRTAEQVEQIKLLRDIFGNPFRPVAFDPAWLTADTLGIAARMYERRDFSAMHILADALEEAGCTNPDLLLHAREPGVHIRGCWVVDGVLGKS
jgi:hypothetical protein